MLQLPRIPGPRCSGPTHALRRAADPRAAPSSGAFDRSTPTRGGHPSKRCRWHPLCSHRRVDDAIHLGRPCRLVGGASGRWVRRRDATDVLVDRLFGAWLDDGDDRVASSSPARVHDGHARQVAPVPPDEPSAVAHPDRCGWPGRPRGGGTGPAANSLARDRQPQASAQHCRRLAHRAHRRDDPVVPPSPHRRSAPADLARRMLHAGGARTARACPAASSRSGVAHPRILRRR